MIVRKIVRLILMKRWQHVYERCYHYHTVVLVVIDPTLTTVSEYWVIILQILNILRRTYDGLYTVVNNTLYYVYGHCKH